MEEKNYIVTKIEGEYAYLKELDSDNVEELFIAMALLPPNTDVGAKLHWEMFNFTISE